MIFYKKIKNDKTNLLLLSNHLKKIYCTNKIQLILDKDDFQLSFDKEDKNELLINVHYPIEYGEIGLKVRILKKESDIVFKVSLIAHLEIVLYFLMLLAIAAISIAYTFNIDFILNNLLILLIYLTIASLAMLKMYFKSKKIFYLLYLRPKSHNNNNLLEE